MSAKRDRWASSSEDEQEAVIKPASKKRPAETNTPGLPQHNPLLQGCRSVYDTYERLERLSEGTYGVVWKARDLATNQIYALKQIKFHQGEGTFNLLNSAWKEGFPVTALREISVLLALVHPSIVSVREMVVGDGLDKVFMVMEYFDCDLKEALAKASTGGPLAQSELKGILQQILKGTSYMHDSGYLHRDLKPSNILVKTSESRIALADFGLARRFDYEPRRKLTLPVVTLWYRAPELLFGEYVYGPEVDMWSIGCIFGELIESGGNYNVNDEEDDSNAILKGQGELDQIDQIFSLVGVPNKTTWPSFDALPNASILRWKPNDTILLSSKFPVASSTSSQKTFLDANGYGLLEGLLTLDPAKRTTACDALEHPYLSQGVKPRLPQFFTTAIDGN